MGEKPWADVLFAGVWHGQAAVDAGGLLSADARAGGAERRLHGGSQVRVVWAWHVVPWLMDS
jgi:hypothetical protein